MKTVLSAACIVMGLATTASAQARNAIALPGLMRTAESYALGDGAASLVGLGSIGVNPAGIHVRRPEALAQYQSLPLQTSLSMFGMAFPVRKVDTTFGLNYLSLRSTNFDKRGEAGEALGSFTDEERIVALSVGRPFRLGRVAHALGRDDGTSFNPLQLGLTAKLMDMKIDGHQGSAMAYDVGGRYAMRSIPLSVGVAVLNLGKAGPQLKSEASKLPLTYVFSGAAKTGAVTWLGSASRHVAEASTEVSFGVQASMGQVLALRGRYAVMQGPLAAAQGGLQNISGGFGFNLLDGKTLDYAFQVFDQGMRQAGAAGSHRLTVTFRFGKSADAEYEAPQERDWSSRFRSGATYPLPVIEGIDRGRSRGRRSAPTQEGSVWRSDNTSATW